MIRCKNLAEQGISQISTEDIEIRAGRCLAIRSHGVTPEIFERIMKTEQNLPMLLAPMLPASNVKPENIMRKDIKLLLSEIRIIRRS